MFNTKHRVVKLGSLLAVASLGLAGLTGISSAQAADTTTTFRVHIDKTLPTVTTENVYYWGAGVTSPDTTPGPEFNGEDAYGAYAQFDVTSPAPLTDLGFKLRADQSWTTELTPTNQSITVDPQAAVQDVWCHLADKVCDQTAPAKKYLVRVHVNRVLADTQAQWDLYTFGTGFTPPGTTPGFTGTDSVDGVETGSYAEFTFEPTDPNVAPGANLNSGAGPLLDNGIGAIVRSKRDDWGTKRTGDVGVNFNADNVGEMWCDVVDASANPQCVNHAPDPVTHVTVHINKPQDAAHNYAIWDNHITNNTDGIFAPTFNTEDRYGAISKFKFTDTSVHSVRFYITDGRTFDSPKITGPTDMTIPISAFSGEVWCDVVSSTPTCSTDKPVEHFNIKIHVNKPAADITSWNVWNWGVGSGSVWHAAPTPEEGYQYFAADGDNNSVASWNVTTDNFPTGPFGFLIRNSNVWDASAQKMTVGDQLVTIPGINSADGVTTIEAWCDASALVVPVSGDAQAGSAVVCSSTPTSTVTVHYNRPLASLKGWELAVFGTGAMGDTRVQFTGEDAFGATAVIHYNPSITDTSAISFVVRKYQEFAASTASTIQVDLDPWSCIDPLADCTGGFFRQTTGDRVVPSGASEVWTLAGSSEISDSQITDMPSNDIKLTTQLLGGGRVRVYATAGSGVAPTAIVVDTLNRKGVSLKPGVSCTIGRSKVGTTLAPYCNIKGLKKGVKYRFKAHALTYGVGSSRASARTAPITVK